MSTTNVYEFVRRVYRFEECKFASNVLLELLNRMNSPARRIRSQALIRAYWCAFVVGLLFRISDFGFLSAFGLRVSDLVLGGLYSKRGMPGRSQEVWIEFRQNGQQTQR